MNKWARHLEWNSGSAAPGGANATHSATLYFAFLSYSHQDTAEADWLHGELERFRVPSSLAGRLTATGVVPKRLTPIFRDRHELAAADDLGEEIREALAGSRCLIVLCSPAAAKSKWTNAEIETFKQLHPEGCIIAAIVAGEPFASDTPGREQEECLPPALRQKYDKRGRPTGKRAEPLAADLREGHGGRRLGFLKVVAGMLGLGLDDLVQREQLRRQRRLAGIAAGSLGGMVIASVLAVTAIDARDAARDQRREAESLVEFMLGDVRETLEPLGKLDALDGVGSRVLQYYEKQDTSELSDAGLAQRSKALTLMGQIASARGDLDRAHGFYRAAHQGTAEAIRRDPDNPQRLFDHAQNAFHLADVALRRGDLRPAEAAFRQYKSLADRMVEIEPDDMKWRMEVQYADVNLGTVLRHQRRFAAAAAQFSDALTTMQAIATADPDNHDYQKQVAESLAWLSDAQARQGALGAAMNTSREHVALLERLLPQSGGDVGYRQRLVVAHRELGNLYAQRGQLDAALKHLRAAVDHGEKLLATEPTNTRWLDHMGSARLNLARRLLERGGTQKAAIHANSACRTYERLRAQDASVQSWRKGLRDCLLVRARLAMHSGANGDAVRLAADAVRTARSVATRDPVEDRFALARALRVLGDARKAAGGDGAARSAWMQAAATVPADVAETPSETNEHATILERVGRSAQAQQLRSRLASIGFRQAEI